MPRLNKPCIELHLREALEQLQKTVQQLGDSDFNEYDLEFGVAHAYNHINTAWNSRFATDAEVERLQGPLFYEWRAFPTDINMGRPPEP